MILTLEEALYSRSWLISCILGLEVSYDATEGNLYNMLQLIWLLWLVANQGMGIFEAIVISGETVELPNALLYYIQDHEDSIREWEGRFSPNGSLEYIIEL